MIRKIDRVVGMLMIWVGVFISMIIIMTRLSYAHLVASNYWYYANVVSGATSEQAMRINDDLSTIGQQFYMQAQQFAQAELLTYLPYILLVAAMLLAGAVLSTFFIWRSVLVPDSVTEALVAEDNRQSLTELLEDGELVDLAAAGENVRKERRG